MRSTTLGLFSSMAIGLVACNGGGGTTQSPATPPAITSYSINGVNGVITGNYIAVQLPESTDTTNLIATYSVQNTNNVTVNGIKDTSGISRNNFTRPVKYILNSYNSINNITSNSDLNNTESNDTVVYTVAVNYGTLSTNMTSSTIYNCTTGFESATYVYLTGATALIGQSVYLYSETEFGFGSNDMSKVATVDANGNAQMVALISGPMPLLDLTYCPIEPITFTYYGSANESDYSYPRVTVYPTMQKSN